MHPLIQEVTKAKYNCSFEGIPNSSEKLLSLTITPPNEAHPIRVIDSLQFMMGSLSSVVENQKKEMKTKEEGFPRFCQVFRSYGYDDETISFLLKKNEFPYEWLDSYEKLHWPIQSMPLNTPTDFKRLRITTVWQYLLVYLLCDGLQLADVFESFCKHIKHTHNVNPLFFYGAPGLSFSAMLYQFRDSDVHPVMLSEPNMAGFFTQMIRGGTAYICTRYAEASENESIIYLDANNLYGWAMSQKLPYGGFRWMDGTG